MVHMASISDRVPVEPSDTASRILTAAVDAAATFGIGRLTVGDVAKRAGVSRVTLYKHFCSKDELVAAAVAREADRMVAEVLAVDEDSANDGADPRTALERVLAAVLRVTRDHPLLDRVIRTEPEVLLPLLLSDSGPVTVRVRDTVEAVLARRFGPLDGAVSRRFADVVTRLLVSFAVNAPDDPPEYVAAFVATVLVDGAGSYLDLTSTPKEQK